MSLLLSPVRSHSVPTPCPGAPRKSCQSPAPPRAVNPFEVFDMHGDLHRPSFSFATREQADMFCARAHTVNPDADWVVLPNLLLLALAQPPLKQ